MLNLSTLKFDVDTSALVEAKKALDNLANAQKNLSATGGNVGKGADASGKGVENLGKGAERASSQLKGMERVLERQATKMQVLRGEVVNLGSETSKLDRAFTSGQAGMLASAKLAGATKEQFEKLAASFTDLNKLMGVNPFDKSASGVNALTKEVEELRNVNKLASEGIKLTTQEIRNLSRDLDAAKQSFDNGQLSATKYEEVVAKIRAETIRLSAEKANLQQASKLLEQQVKEEATAHQRAQKAQQIVAKEMQRVDAVLGELNRDHSEGSVLSERHANSISRFANQLKAAGITGSAATTQLEQYRIKMQQIEAIENKRAEKRLASALTPQVSDVAVSLAGGMPLHLVIMQQGLQIRDLIDNSGVAADRLKETMRTAMKQSVTSIGFTIAALGQMTFGALADAGKATVDFSSKLIGVNGILKNAETNLLASAAAGNTLSTAILGIVRAANMAAVALAATGVGALVIGLTAAAVAFVQLIGANNALARELAVTGNVFGVTTENSLQYVEGLTKVGATTREAIGILGEMSKAGNLSREQIVLIGEAAVNMERAAGVAIDETIKRFSDMAKDPVKALSTLQIQTGAVQPEIIKLVDELTKQGNAAKASGVAVEELARIMGVQSKKMVEDLHPVTQFFDYLLRKISEVWTGIGNLINQAMGNVPEAQKISERMAKRQEDIDSTRSNLSMLGKFGKNDRLVQLQEEQKADNRRLLNLQQIAQAEKDLARQRSDDEKARVKADEIRSRSLTKEQQQLAARNKLLDEYDFLMRRGTPMDGKAYAERYQKEVIDPFKEKGGGSSRAAAAKEEVNFYKEIDKVYTSMINKANELTPLEIKLNEIRTDPTFLKLKKDEQDAIIAYLKTKALDADATITENAYREQQIKLYQEYQKEQESILKGYQDSAKSAEERLASMQEENKAIALSEQMQISLAQAIELVAVARLEEKRAKLLSQGADGETLLALQKEIEARRQIANELGRRDLKEDADNAAKSYSESIQKEFDAMRDGIADSITTALFEGGKAGSQKLRTLIVNELKKPVVLMVQAVVNTLLGSIFGGGGGGSSTANAIGAGGGSGVGSLQNLLSQGQSFLNGSYMTDTAIKYISNMGSQIGGDIGAKMVMNANSYGSVAGAAGNAFAGYAMGKTLRDTISGGYSVGKGYNKFQEIGMAVASAIGGPVLGAIIGAATGAVNRLFGRKLKDTGIEGTFGGESGFSGNTYQFYKGGLFRSNKTVKGELDPAMRKGFSDQFTGLKSNIIDMAKTLGLGSDALASFSKNVKISFQGLNEQQIQEKIAETFDNLAIEMTDLLTVPDDAVDSDKKLATSIDDLTSSTALLGKSIGDVKAGLEETSKLSSNASSNLLKFSEGIGSISNSTGASANAFNNLLSKLQGATDSLKPSISGLESGLTGLKTGIDSTSNSAEVSTAKTTKGLKDYAKEGETSYQTLERLANRLNLVNSTFDALGQTLFKASLAGADMASKLVELFGGVEQFSSATTFYYQNFYTEQERAATLTRQLTSTFADLGLKLPDSIQSFRALVESQDLTTDAGRRTYAALMQLAPAFNEVNNAAQRVAEERYALETQLLELQGNTNKLRERELQRLDPSNQALQQQIWAAEQSRQQQQAMADAYRDQADAAREAQQAFQELGNGIRQEIKRLRGDLLNDSPDQLSFLSARFASTTAAARAGDNKALESLPEISQAIEKASIATATSAVDIARMRGYLSGSLEETLLARGMSLSDLPSFDVGTNYVQSDMVAKIHEGEAIIPAKHNPYNPQNESIVSNRIDALINEVSMLRAETRAVVNNTAKTSRILDDVTQDGNTLTVSTETGKPLQVQTV